MTSPSHHSARRSTIVPGFLVFLLLLYVGCPFLLFAPICWLDHALPGSPAFTVLIFFVKPLDLLDERSPLYHHYIASQRRYFAQIGILPPELFF